jgi:hypothetical protein
LLYTQEGIMILHSSDAIILPIIGKK